MSVVADRSLDEAFAAFLSGEDSDALCDPYPLYARLRRDAPVFRYGEQTVVLTRFADVKAARLDPRVPSPDERLGKFEGRFSRLSDADLEAYREIADFERLMLSRHDGDAHRRYRRALVRAFTPRRMAEWPERIQAIVDDELELLGGEGPVDLIPFAYRVPLLVIMELMGAPARDAERIKHWGDALIESIMCVPLDPALVQLGRTRLDEYRSYARELIERQRCGEDERTGVVGLLLDAEEGDTLTREQIVATFMHFLFAGHETTTNLIGNGMLSLLTNPAQWELICADPALHAADAVEESLRYESPSQISMRSTTAAVELGGVDLPAGLSVMVGNAAANRDPEAFPDPDRFDITRCPNDHMALGWGNHFCLGAPLARLEGRIVFETLAQRFPAIELACDPNELLWVPRPRLRGLERLPVELARSSGS